MPWVPAKSCNRSLATLEKVVFSTAKRAILVSKRKKQKHNLERRQEGARLRHQKALFTPSVRKNCAGKGGHPRQGLVAVSQRD